MRGGEFGTHFPPWNKFSCISDPPLTEACLELLVLLLSFQIGMQQPAWYANDFNRVEMEENRTTYSEGLITRAANSGYLKL